MVKMIAWPVLVLCLVPAVVEARDLGAFGQLYPIEEQSLLEVIVERFRRMEETGGLETLREQSRARVRASVERPQGRRLPRAGAPRAFDVDLSITVERDISDHTGRVFARAGSRVNPLDYSRFSKRIVMIDGDDAEQVAFALSEGTELDTLIVLVSGAPLALMRAHGRRFWFDQHGVIAGRFGIEALPSVITRGEGAMRVTEIVLGEGLR